MKAVLVTEMPETCQDCHFREYNQCYAVESCYRTLIEKWDGTDEFKTRNKICPLKPMPEKIEKRYITDDGYIENYTAYKKGWNDCIDEIIGGTI